MTSKLEWDAERWNADPSVLPEEWTRIPVPAGVDAWDVLPDEVADEVDHRILIEWRPSSIMGWGAAAVWIGPLDSP